MTTFNMLKEKYGLKDESIPKEFDREFFVGDHVKTEVFGEITEISSVRTFTTKKETGEHIEFQLPLYHVVGNDVDTWATLGNIIN